MEYCITNFLAYLMPLLTLLTEIFYNTLFSTTLNFYFGNKNNIEPFQDCWLKIASLSQSLPFPWLDGQFLALWPSPQQSKQWRQTFSIFSIHLLYRYLSFYLWRWSLTSFLAFFKISTSVLVLLNSFCTDRDKSSISTDIFVLSRIWLTGDQIQVMLCFVFYFCCI